MKIEEFVSLCSCSSSLCKMGLGMDVGCRYASKGIRILIKKDLNFGCMNSDVELKE